MSACQAIEFRRPLKSSAILEFAHDQIRGYVDFAEEDRIFADDIVKDQGSQIAKLFVCKECAGICRFDRHQFE